MEKEFKLKEGTPKIVLENGALSLDECQPCVQALMELEAEAAKSFVKQKINIRRADTGRSSNSRYTLRAKGGGGGGHGGGKAGGGAILSLEASATDTVEKLKLAVFLATDVEPALQVLTFGTTVLEDEQRNLISYGISAGCTIDLVSLLYDGADPEVAPSSSRSGAPRRAHQPEKGFQGSLLHGDFNNLPTAELTAQTNHDSSGVACPSCTFINHGSKVCTMCDFAFGNLEPEKKRNKSKE